MATEPLRRARRGHRRVLGVAPSPRGGWSPDLEETASRSGFGTVTTVVQAIWRSPSSNRTSAGDELMLRPVRRALAIPTGPGIPPLGPRYPDAMSGRIERYAKLHVPPWLWGGDPRGLMEGSRLISRESGVAGVWSVQTEESYYRRRPDLLTDQPIAAPGRSPRFELLRTALPHPNVAPSAWAIEQVNRIGSEVRETTDFAPVMVHAQLALLAAPHAELTQLAQSIFEQISAIPMQGNAGERPFGNASFHLISHDPALLHRLKLASVWLRMEYDEQLRGGDAQHLTQGEGTLAFASASDLYSGMLMMDAYLAPLLGCSSPFIWGVLVPREGGNLLLSLGSAVRGTRRDAAEPLQTLATQSGNRALARPTLTPSSCDEAIRWWTAALNNMFGVLSDLSVFVDGDGFYSAAGHMHALLTIEQLFRRVLSVQAAYRDTHARRVVLFTVLDTLQRLTGRPLEKHCSLHFARRTLSRLEEAMDGSAAMLLLPRAREGVQALAEMQTGFFMNDGDKIPVPDGKQPDGVKDLSLDAAVAQYIKVLRDATHGHGSNKENVAGRTNALLARHTGAIPHELGWLGYLYLLDVLSRPEVLRRTLQSRIGKG